MKDITDTSMEDPFGMTPDHTPPNPTRARHYEKQETVDPYFEMLARIVEKAVERCGAEGGEHAEWIFSGDTHKFSFLWCLYAMHEIGGTTWSVEYLRGRARTNWEEHTGEPLPDRLETPNT
jgi:hypothetical protein